MANLILKGPPCNIPKIEKGMGEYFFEQAEKLGDKVFQIDGDTGKQETYQDVKRRSTRVAIYLRSVGIQPKDIVVLCCKSNLDNIIPALATLYLGAYVASIDPKQTVSDIKHSLALLQPKALVVEEDSLDLIETSLKDSNQKPTIIVIGSSASKYPNMLDIEKEEKGESSFKPVQQKRSDIAVILFSSGTTSAPKGIYLTHWAMLNTAPLLIQHKHFKIGVLLHFSSLYWISAWILTAICIATGTAKVVAPAISAEQFLKIVDKFKVTYVFCSNTFSYQVTNLDKGAVEKYDTTSLHSLSMGGSTMDPNQIRRLRQYLPHTHVNLAYGSSEANFMVGHSYTNEKVAREKIMSSGTILPDMQMKFVGLETEKLVGPNQEGEIRIKSNYIMAGYHKFSNPDAFDEDGFLKVGDIGYYDEDGYIYITDRLSDMFKYKTYQISPTLLENVILQHPAVNEAIAFGVPHFVDRNHPAAGVVLKSGATATPEEIAEFVNSKVSDSYQLRRGVMILTSIPKTPTGKYKRRTVRDNFIKLREGN